MKKIVCVLILICIIMGAAFAQQKPATPAPAPAKPANPPSTTPAKPTTPPQGTQPAAPAQGAQPAAPETAPAEGPKDLKNAVVLDLFPLFKGFIATDTEENFLLIALSVAYERLLFPHFSVGADMDMYFMGFDGTPGFYFGLAAESRYYPMSVNMEKVFLGATLGFNLLSIDGKTNNGGFIGMIVSLKAGYKLLLTKNLYVEPSISYVLSKSSIASSFGVPTPLGWNGGLRVGFMF